MKPSASCRPLVVVCLAALPCPPLPAQTDAEIVRALLKDAERVQVAERDLPEAARKKLAQALGDDTVPVKIALGVGREMPNPMEDPETLETVWGIVAASGRVRVGVIAFRDPAAQDRLGLADVCVLAPADAPAAETYAESLRWEALGPNAYEPLSAFRALSQAAETGTDEPARQRKWLLAHVREMQEMEARQKALKRAVAAKDVSAAPALADAIFAGLERSQKAYEQADFLFGGATDAAAKQRLLLAQQSAKALEEAKALQQAAASKNIGLVSRRLNALACAPCHGSFEKLLQGKRAELKIGNGYFVPGHDVPPAEGETAALAPEVAAAARKALLVIDQLVGEE